MTIKRKGKVSVINKYIVYVRERGFPTQHPKKRTVHHINMTENAIHFWRAGPSCKEMIQTLHYQKRPPYLSELQANTIVETEIPNLSLVERVFDLDMPVGDSGRRPRLLLRRMPVDMMRHVIHKFSLPRCMVLDPCPGTRETGKGCLLEPKDWQFIGYEADSCCRAKMTLSRKKGFSKQVLNKNPDINADDDVQ